MAMAGQKTMQRHRRGRAGGSRRGDERSKNYPPPYGNGLLLRLIAQPAFLEAAPLQGEASGLSLDVALYLHMIITPQKPPGSWAACFVMTCSTENTRHVVPQKQF